MQGSGYNFRGIDDVYNTISPLLAKHGLCILPRVLARECVEHGYSRLSWAVLDWNSPAIALYDAVGGRQMSEWITYRVSGSELSALADE